MSAQPPVKPAVDDAPFDCLVFSGGGAKGAYSAGAAQALVRYRRRLNRNGPVCYVGTSAGALNAAVLAAHGPGRLIQLWKRINSKAVLGARFGDWRPNLVTSGFRRMAGASTHFSIYTSTALRQLIGRHVDFAALADRSLIVCATDFTHGTLSAFFASRVVADMKKRDREDKLAHFEPIRDQADLIDVLLASCSIPVAFPPVSRGKSWYVDGGIGNHTPTREAAYFLRFLDPARRGTTYCVNQDPLGVVDTRSSELGLAQMFARTIEVYHHVHTEPILRGWSRINAEVEAQHKKLARLEALIDQSGASPAQIAKLRRVAKELASLGGAAERVDTPLVQIRPGAELGDTLDFSNARIRALLARGYAETLQQLRHLGAASEKACEQLAKIAVDEDEP